MLHPIRTTTSVCKFKADPLSDQFFYVVTSNFTGPFFLQNRSINIPFNSQYLFHSDFFLIWLFGLKTIFRMEAIILNRKNWLFSRNERSFLQMLYPGPDTPLCYMLYRYWYYFPLGLKHGHAVRNCALASGHISNGPEMLFGSQRRWNRGPLHSVNNRLVPKLADHRVI